MLLLYDARKVRDMLKKTEALRYLSEVIAEILAQNPEPSTQKRIQELDFGIRAIYETYTTKPIDQAFYETHREYIDFQFVLSGEELFCVGDSESFVIKQEYDKERDLIIYQAPQDLEHLPLITLKPRSLAVFFPCDVHAGGLHIHKSETIVKCVLKVPAQLLKFSF